MTELYKGLPDFRIPNPMDALKAYTQDNYVDYGIPAVNTSGISEAAATAANTPFEPTILQQLGGYTDPSNGMKVNGLGGLAINGISSLLGALSSYNNLKLGKESLQNSKDQFNKNFGMQQAVLKGNVQNKSYAGALARGKSEADAQAYASSKLSEYGLA